MVKYNFLGKAAEEIREENNPEILNNSKFIKWLLDGCRAWKDKAITYSGTSIVVKLIKKIYFFPVKTISIILVPTILINILFFIKHNEEVGLLGWIIRVLFLFIGLGGVFCNAYWQDLKKGSFIINYMDKHYKF